MKKRLLLIVMILVLAAIPLTGCENSFKKDRLSEKQDTSYTVEGNGGNAVQYGNFIYFINGYRGYEDTDAKNNVWGNVIKGALYRVKLLGEKKDGEFVTKADEFTRLDFSTKPFVVDRNGYEYNLTDEDFNAVKDSFFIKETDLNLDLKDEDDYEPDIIEETFYIDDIDYRVNNVELVAPKVIGTSGYSDGGIFIFDNYVYYASPNNQRSKSGEVQVNKTDFFRTDLNGTKTERIYTTSSDSSSSPYGFYKQGSYTYLVVLDGSDIVSVKMNSSKVVSKNTLADNATGAYFPTKANYNKNNNQTNGVEDFVYYTRAVEKEDGAIKTGNVIEVTRPNGKNRFELVKNGKTSQIEAVKDGLVFYRTTNNLNRQELHYTNMHEALLAYNDNQSSYNELVVGIALEEIRLEYTSIYCHRPTAQDANGNLVYDNNIYIIGFTTSAVYTEDINSRIKILDGQVLSTSVYQNRLYYADANGVFNSVDIFTPFAENVPHIIETKGASSSVIRNSIVAGYFVFMGTVDEHATAYAKFYPINGGDGAKSVFVGERLKEEMHTPKD